MTKTVVNLLTSAVAREVEDVLSAYDDHPFQQAFANPDLRQELIAYVLNRATGSYAAIDDEEISIQGLPELTPLFTEQMALRAWIHEGIRTIIERHADTINQLIPELDDPGLAPSHWFG